jgi:DNA-binding transcriptional MerR regulator
LTAKGPNAFRTISEAADEVGAPAHVLRFWETKFSCIKPLRRAGGRRFYRPADVEVLAAVRRLLHENGHAIRDLQKLTAKSILEKDRELAGAPAGATAAAPPPTSAAADRVAGLKSALARAILAKSRLDSLLGQSSS